MNFTRLAIYYVPKSGLPWADFATALLGWDIETASPKPHPALGDLPVPISDVTDTPRRYGLHATLKPPFRLVPGTSLDALATACATLAASFVPPEAKGLHLGRLGRFLALVPTGSDKMLSDLATACVRDLDRFRAAPDPAELDRRRAGRRLSDRQNALLGRWGYPYVMQEFRFHISLTGRLPRPILAQVEAAIGHHLTPLLPTPFVLSDIALAGEDDAGYFHLIDRFELGG